MFYGGMTQLYLFPIFTFPQPKYRDATPAKQTEIYQSGNLCKMDDVHDIPWPSRLL